jgi:hypothetical protein
MTILLEANLLNAVIQTTYSRQNKLARRLVRCALRQTNKRARGPHSLRVCAGCFRYASSGLNTETRYRRRDQKSAELSVHKMVADAVQVEPVSTPEFPANREINRELRRIRPLDAISIADTRANSEACNKIPHSTEQGIFAKEQGICTREQGI